MLRIKLVRSPIGNTKRNRATVAALGLRKMHQTVVHQDTPAIRGMIHKVKHMLEVEVVADEAKAAAPKAKPAKAEAAPVEAAAEESKAKAKQTTKPKAEAADAEPATESAEQPAAEEN